ncbi:uncharacterized protein PG998_006471 [Apiospora kogelbergensis]|uniref:uncharacterized protein n=1 Tax=Apiospora kogelbergensis TaxID=1337665 RepID=UPI00312DE465
MSKRGETSFKPASFNVVEIQTFQSSIQRDAIVRRFNDIYTLYRMHDCPFRIYSAMFAGQSRVALKTVARMEALLTADFLNVRSTPMADWLEDLRSGRGTISDKLSFASNALMRRECKNEFTVNHP